MPDVDSPRADSVGAGAPADEIEITPAMIEAGVRAFCAYDPDIERPRDVVPDIFRAMMSARVSPEMPNIVPDWKVWAEYGDAAVQRRSAAYACDAT